MVNIFINKFNNENLKKIMKFSILINTHNQEKYLNRAIMSCLNQDFKDYEIIVCDTSDKKNPIKINKLAFKKKFKYFHLMSKYKQPEQNQMSKILFGLKKSKGDFICLMDGDDFFNKKKLFKLNELTRKKNIFFNQDNPALIKNNSIISKKIKKKLYKNNFLFNVLINDWPQIYGTSSILIKRKILEKFFKTSKPFRWKYLAIDAQLAIFCKINFKIKNYFENITKKNIHVKSLGNEYLNILNKNFWLRRSMQHKYCAFIKKENKINIDFIFTNIISYFFKKL